MTELADIITAEISENGPIPISQFMSTALFHPTLGYYTSRTVFGSSGDFVTAPEISQMFGELVGLALAQSWIDQGRPSPFQLVELGPGRGTLMSDLLRATKGVAGFHQAAQIILIEASPNLTQIQRNTLSGYDITWADSIHALQELPTFLIANEFFDALPIRQYQRIDDVWRERVIGLKDDALTIGLGGVAQSPYLLQRMSDTVDGDIVETCPQAAPLVDQIGTLIETKGGLGLIFDYGNWRSLGDTLQALRAHDHVSPLDHIGHADITAHVDFEALVQTCPARHTPMTDQGVWLERLGITARAQTLARALSGAALENHIHAHRRLTHPDEMGKLFKVIALYPSTAPYPVGFDT